MDFKKLCFQLRYKQSQIQQLDDRLQTIHDTEFKKYGPFYGMREIHRTISIKAEGIIAEKFRLVTNYNILYANYQRK